MNDDDDLVTPSIYEPSALTPEQVRALFYTIDNYLPFPPNEHLQAYLRKAANVITPDLDLMEFKGVLKTF